MFKCFLRSGEPALGPTMCVLWQWVQRISLTQPPRSCSIDSIELTAADPSGQLSLALAPEWWHWRQIALTTSGFLRAPL